MQGIVQVRKDTTLNSHIPISILNKISQPSPNPGITKTILKFKLFLVRAGSFGILLEYGVEKQVTKHSVLGATMVVGLPLGVTLRIKLSRGQQTYTVPLRLSDEVAFRKSKLVVLWGMSVLVF